MCGIFGCIVNGVKAAPLIHSALKRLEYRGYDSAGIATIYNGLLFLKKDSGRIDEIHKKLDLNNLPGMIGIGHTRWATHGAPSMENAHPHTDCTGKIAIVHNGIIENYIEIKKLLESKGHIFKSRTDSEVFAHLIEDNIKNNMSFEDSVKQAVKLISGSYAIAAIHADEDKILCVKNESPLVIGVNDNGVFCASDIPALLPYTNRVIELFDGEMAVLSLRDIKIIRIENGSIVQRHETIIDWTMDMAEKGGFPHFMLKEIYEQPRAIRNTLRIDKRLINIASMLIENSDKLFLVACGTSYHACLAASYIFSELSLINVIPCIASEFLKNYAQLVDENTVVIAVSQSGETRDTLTAVRNAKMRGAQIIGVTNVIGSELTRISDIYLNIQAGPEIGVAATKTYISQLTLLSLLAINFSHSYGLVSENTYRHLLSELYETSVIIEKYLRHIDNEARRIAQAIAPRENIFYLSRGINVASALEGALKLKEISYIHAEGYPAGESKHGPIALVEEGFPCIFITPAGETSMKMLGNIMEMKARGAKIISITQDNAHEVKEVSDITISIESNLSEILTPIIFSPPLQLIAYHTAILRLKDPDKPRNLAKSVTVP
ncbi:MAG: glutamine--fructose-6-phosphate transaminase (isomerizing) [Candidatus Methanomethylicia archaeon]